MFAERLRIHRIEGVIDICLFRTFVLLDFKVSSYSVCCILSFGWFPRRLNFICRRFGSHCQVHLYRWCKPTTPIEMDLTECSEISAHKFHTPGNHPKERINFFFPLLFKNRIKICTIPSFNILVCVLVKFGLAFRGRSTDGEWLWITGSWRAQERT